MKNVILSTGKKARDAMTDYMRLDPAMRVLMEQGEWHILTTSAADVKCGMVYVLGLYGKSHRMAVESLRGRVDKLREYIAAHAERRCIVEAFFEESRP